MYLNKEAQPKYEYTLYVQVGTAHPYTINIYKDFNQVLDAIEDIKNKHCYYWNREFYIDNDFYKNKFDRSMTGTYYKFLRREVKNWEEFNTKEENKKDNIYYLNFCN